MSKMSQVYKSGKSKKPSYKIYISPKKIRSMKNKKVDQIMDELLHYNLRLYKNGKRLKIGSLELTVKMFSNLGGIE